MNKFLATVDRAALSLREGFVTAALGWRGAVAVFVLAESATVLTLLAVGATVVPWARIGAANSCLVATTAVVVLGGSLLFSLKRMAGRPPVREADCAA